MRNWLRRAGSRFRTGPSSLSRGEIAGLAQHLGCVPFTAADVDRVERWLASGVVHSNVVYDVDGRVAGAGRFLAGAAGVGAAGAFGRGRGVS